MRSAVRTSKYLWCNSFTQLYNIVFFLSYSRYSSVFCSWHFISLHCISTAWCSDMSSCFIDAPMFNVYPPHFTALSFDVITVTSTILLKDEWNNTYALACKNDGHLSWSPTASRFVPFPAKGIQLTWQRSITSYKTGSSSIASQQKIPCRVFTISPHS